MRPLKTIRKLKSYEKVQEWVTLTSNIRPRAAIRTAGHAHDNRVIPQAVLLADLLHFVNE